MSNQNVTQTRGKADARRLDKTSVPGIFRRHIVACKRDGRCKCPYIVTFRERGKSRKQMCGTFEQAREMKGQHDSGKGLRRKQSAEAVAAFYERWLPSYTGRTSRGLEDATRREYEISFRLHILPLPIAHLRMRDAAAPDVRDWLKQLERGGRSPSTIRRAKAALSVMFACAVEDGDVGSNPVTGVRYVPSETSRQRHPRRKHRALTAADVVAILGSMPEQWRVFFTLLAQSGVRIGELLGLTWANVHLGDDAHVMVAEQVYRGQRKKVKTEASRARVPISATMASWLAELRPEDTAADAPVFASITGTPLNYANVYNRVLRPALVAAGLAVVVGENAKGEPVYDYQGIAFHSFRRACGSLLLAHGKTLKQVQGWLRHSQLTTTMNVYIHQVDDGLGSADAWDDIMPGWGNSGATGHPETAATAPAAQTAESAA